MDTSWMLAAQLASRGEAQRKYLEESGCVDTYGNWGLKEGKKEGLKWS